MDLIEKYLGEKEEKAYKIYKGNNIIGNVALDTAKKIHGKMIDKIDHKKGIVWLKKESQYGK